VCVLLNGLKGFRGFLVSLLRGDKGLGGFLAFWILRLTDCELGFLFELVRILTGKDCSSSWRWDQ